MLNKIKLVVGAAVVHKPDRLPFPLERLFALQLHDGETVTQTHTTLRKHHRDYLRGIRDAFHVAEVHASITDFVPKEQGGQGAFGASVQLLAEWIDLLGDDDNEVVVSVIKGNCSTD